jgi:hypothetical protein
MLPFFQAVVRCVFVIVMSIVAIDRIRPRRSAAKPARIRIAKSRFARCGRP